MPKTKPPLTRAEHEALGKELQTMFLRIQKLSLDLGERYGVSKKPYLQTKKVHRALMELRSVMDDVVAGDCRAEGLKLSDLELNHLYYPGSEQPSPA